MANPVEKRIYRLSGGCGVLVVAALIVPRFVSNPEGGFASGASAVLAFLGMLGVALLFSLYLLAITLQRYAELPLAARIAGLVPFLLLAAALVFLFGFLRY